MRQQLEKNHMASHTSLQSPILLNFTPPLKAGVRHYLCISLLPSFNYSTWHTYVLALLTLLTVLFVWMSDPPTHPPPYPSIFVDVPGTISLLPLVVEY